MKKEKTEKCGFHGNIDELPLKLVGFADRSVAVFLCESCYEYVITPFELWT